nr:extracellular solute-binding protein [Demetria terragena]
MSRRSVLRFVGGAVAVAPLTACGSDHANTLRISYQQFGSGRVMEAYIKQAAADFSKNRPGTAVELVPLVAAENDYFTKNELMMSSSRTACDLVYEDTFILESDVAAGYLRPIDEYISKWPEWKRYHAVTREAVKAEDGKTYGVPIATDTRGIWYHSEVLEKAGIKAPWQPKTWDDLLEAARTIKRELPGVIPLNIYASKASGEKTSMQGFEMLLYGTDSTLYDEDQKKWVIGSQGFRDSLQFIRTVYSEKLGPPLSSALDPNLAETAQNGWFPKGEMAMMIDGSWISRAWLDDGPGKWPKATEVVKLATMPTQRGQGAGITTLAGGHSWAFPAKAQQHDLAFEFVRHLCSLKNLSEVTINDRNVTTRTDIAELPAYKNSSTFLPFFTNLVKDATYRPALAPYPQISTAIQVACEQVMTGSRSPAQAARAYDNAVIEIVGRDHTTKEA